MTGTRRPGSSHLVVLTYTDEYRAAEVLATLQRLHSGGLVEPRDATSVVLGLDWSIKLQYGGSLQDDNARTARAWSTLISALLPAPGATQDLTEYGVHPTFVTAITAAMPPGSSAVFLSLRRPILLRLLPELQRFGGTLLESPIDWAGMDRPNHSAGPGELSAHVE
jgi:uncharacterized membrane protein